LKDLERQFGPCYRTYHRLRVSAVTDELASLVTRLLDQDDRSDRLLAVRMLLHSWRTEHYSPNGGFGKRLETFFLYQFDIGFRFRRADYVRGRIDALLSALAGAGEEAGRALDKLLRSALPNDIVIKAAARLRRDKDETIDELYRLRDHVEFIKWKLSFDRERVREGGGIEARRRRNLVEALKPMQPVFADLDWILRPVDDDQCQKRAGSLYDDKLRPVRQSIEKAADLLAGWYREILGDLSKKFTDALGPTRILAAGASPTQIVREYVRVHHQYFDCRDMQVFTVIQDQLAGEGTPVEIYRVSPLDANLLRTKADSSGNDKLAGAALFDFGAFLSADWRRNDMMWGRLDGAERIISALLPDEADDGFRRQLCDEAFHIIVGEEFTTSKCSGLVPPLLAGLKQSRDPAGKSADQFLDEALRDPQGDLPLVVRQLLKSISNSDELLASFRDRYVKPAGPPVKLSLGRVRRALRIFGKMLEDLDEGAGPFTRVGAGIAVLASELARFAEFCAPPRNPGVLRRYALQLLYAIAAVLIVAGAFLHKSLEIAGCIALGVAAAANVAIRMASKWLFRPGTGGKTPPAIQP
jgi:hypothetical protein